MLHFYHTQMRPPRFAGHRFQKTRRAQEFAEPKESLPQHTVAIVQTKSSTPNGALTVARM
jgi:hypothetical protein